MQKSKEKNEEEKERLICIYLYDIMYAQIDTERYKMWKMWEIFSNKLIDIMLISCLIFGYFGDGERVEDLENMINTIFLIELF